MLPLLLLGRTAFWVYELFQVFVFASNVDFVSILYIYIFFYYMLFSIND